MLRAWRLLPARALPLAALLLAAGCAQLPRTSVVKDQPLEVPQMPLRQANGSIFQVGHIYQPLFEDRRPRMIGDILTIVLNEQVSASKNSASNANRSSGMSLGFSTTSDKPEKVGEFGAEASGDNDFSGSGGSRANNSFTGTITVTVQQVMPNGNLRVVGEKQIAINQGTEYIRFSGLVNPRTITVQNTVSSTLVSMARIEYVGDGYINEAQHMGWLQRFFLNVSPF
ncbi:MULTISPECIES: flagellar basal body L-ring protein FlgH [Azotobacter]|uniref:flagellar basal body L-ring protein FlgH n=1 Tax=Azotobacter TaxID=352 RepID=UPI000045A6AB|nr:flagellar basal body L-ring protein FlgH [Azotobacter vinelandii]WKN24275.1 flagellar basal body L-ring protein FlgH [Azotobacter vinelandii]GLK58238.1 flagellar L-ring protein [Azotobacter vinelandii]SFX89640.1 flagellar L-ring protein precursor FlgH [Azotobacter vinelandii]